MTSANRINTKRIVLSGFAAGVTIFIITGVVNGTILNNDFENWAREMGNVLHPAPMSTAMILWTLMCLIYGLVGVWVYAGIRPRFGAGPKTALLAGLSLWLVGKLATALDFVTLGILPDKLIVGQLIGSFVSVLLGVLVGAWLYKE